MAVTIAHNSKETVSKLIRKEFDSIDWSVEYIYGKAEVLIQTAKDFGLNELAEELENDKKY